MQERELKELWEAEELQISKELTESSWKSLLIRISHFELLEQKQLKRRKQLLFSSGIAASILMPLLMLSVYYLKTHFATTNISHTIYSVPQGETQRVVLPDNTIAYLNTGTVLIVPERFVSNERKVYLIGEAYFKVAKDKKKPFKVLTHLIDIEALGTEFSVLAYSYTQNIKTTLVEGSVIVRATNPQLKNIEPVILQPNQQSSHNLHQKGVSVKGINPGAYISWIDGNLTFDKTPFGEVIERLETQWGAKINYDKKLSNIKISAKFINNEPLDEILILLCQITNTRVSSIAPSIYQIR